jgi:hypothetical protein
MVSKRISLRELSQTGMNIGASFTRLQDRPTRRETPNPVAGGVGGVLSPPA